MKRLALAVAALATLATLSSCSDDSSSDQSSTTASAADSATESTTESATEEVTEETTEETTEEAGADPADGDPERFATAYAQVQALFTELNATQPDTEVATTEEANAAAGLDDTTPLVFADYSELEDGTGGSYCLLVDNGTYLAASYAQTDTGAAGEVDLGDGDCSYDAANALVVGDLVGDTWSVGAEYMADLIPSGVFGS